MRGQSEAVNDSSSRCYWSVHILEKVFSPRYALLHQCPAVPSYIKSAQPPYPLGSSDISGTMDNFQNANELDEGIDSSFLKTVSLWGDVISYLHGIRWKNLEYPWLPISTYTELTQKIYGLEDQSSVKHLFRYAALSGRSSEEMTENLEYWRPWILMQMTHHATSAVLNHPFIHMVALRDANRRAPPRLFLQGVIDQALYHSGWIVRFIKIFKDIRFNICDPLIAHLVAATATIPWLFQFAGDTEASTKARECFETCEDYLKDASKIWPHINPKVSAFHRGVDFILT
jgi:hypothetical protein